MTDHITIPRALLEQWKQTVNTLAALSLKAERHEVGAKLKQSMADELAMPTRCDLCGYQYGHQIGCANNPVDIALSKQAIRAELAKPEQKKPITLEQFRAIAHRTATTYRHRSDPEKSSYAFVDGSSLDDFWYKVCKAIQTTPAWHDAPEVLALKAERAELLAALKAMYSEAIRIRCSIHQKWLQIMNTASAAIAKAEGRTE